MLKMIVFLLFISSQAMAGVTESARRMADSGYSLLALRYLDSVGPSAESDLLKLDIYSRLGKNRELFELSEKMPESAQVLKMKAKAALELEKPALSRKFLRKLIWTYPLSEAELRLARWSVIESYGQEKDGQSVYLCQLKFQQDYGKLAKSEADRFARMLLDLKMERQAAEMLPQVDENPGLLIRLNAGLMTPEDALKQALKKNDWEVVLAAAKDDLPVEIFALEQLLDEGQGNPEVLKKKYLNYALTLANASQLLEGEYGAWFELAEKAKEPVASRSLYYYLWVNANEEKGKALVLLLSSLEKTQALALFPETSLPFEARKVLGEMAFSLKKYQAASGYWSGLSFEKPEEWLNASFAFAKSGNVAEAVKSLAAFLDANPALNADDSTRCLLTARELVRLSSGESLLKTLLAKAEASRKREVLALLGELYESKDPVMAAAYYFDASLGSNDAFSQNAKFLAQHYQIRAGMLDSPPVRKKK